MADPSAVLRCGVCSSLSLKLTFVAVCRALGFPARLNPATGVPEYGEGDRFLPLPAEKALTVDAGKAGSGETGLLTLVNKSGREMNYFEQYSVARLLDGVYQSLTLWGDVLNDRQTLSVEAGDYRILTSARQIDGSVLVRAYYTRVATGGETVLPIALRPDRILEKHDLLPCLCPVWNPWERKRSLCGVDGHFCWLLWNREKNPPSIC